MRKKMPPPRGNMEDESGWKTAHKSPMVFASHMLDARHHWATRYVIYRKINSY
jgi:hypothetical protein